MKCLYNSAPPIPDWPFYYSASDMIEWRCNEFAGIGVFYGSHVKVTGQNLYGRYAMIVSLRLHMSSDYGSAT